jgi:peptidoglycan/LPS O-acetylase OafA/YrhL
MLFHLPVRMQPDVIRSVGWLGVDMFFVLSGYLIGTQLLRSLADGNPLEPGRFYLRRALRILPAYFAVLGFYLVLDAWRDGSAMAPAWRFLTFTQNFGIVPEERVFRSAWSLCVEEHFYLLLPPLLLALRRVRSAAPVLALAAVVLAGGMLLRGVLWADLVAPHLTGPRSDLEEAYIRHIYAPSWSRLDGLACGVLLAAVRLYRAEVWRRIAGPWRALPAALALLAAAMALFYSRGNLPVEPGLLLSQPAAVVGYPLFAAGCALLLSALLDLGPVLPRLPGVSMLAQLAYSLYLTHFAAFRAVGMASGGGLSGLSGIAVYGAASLAAAALLWFTVERPFLALRERWSPGTPQRQRVRAGNDHPRGVLPEMP